MRFSIERDSRGFAGDGIEIGEIQHAESEGFAEGDGELQWVGSRVQDASHRLIMGTLAGDRVNGSGRS